MSETLVFSMKRPLWTLLVVALFALTGCPDDNPEREEATGNVAPDEFMVDVCTAMNDWLADFLAGYQEVKALDPDASAQQAKRTLDTFLDEAVASTDRLIQSVDDAGIPDVEGGAEFSSGLQDALEQASSALADARSDLADLPNDPNRFRTESVELGDTVREQLATAGEAIGEGAPELQAAAANEPACQNLLGTVEG